MKYNVNDLMISLCNEDYILPEEKEKDVAYKLERYTNGVYDIDTVVSFKNRKEVDDYIEIYGTKNYLSLDGLCFATIGRETIFTYFFTPVKS